MICIFVILLTGWCRTRMRPARLVSYAFLFTTNVALSNLTFFEVKFNTLKLLVRGEIILTTDGALLHFAGATSSRANCYQYKRIFTDVGFLDFFSVLLSNRKPSVS